eukprot:9084739-Ditylum_brightwellii.AAC.2
MDTTGGITRWTRQLMRYVSVNGIEAPAFGVCAEVNRKARETYLRLVALKVLHWVFGREYWK